MFWIKESAVSNRSASQCFFTIKSGVISQYYFNN